MEHRDSFLSVRRLSDALRDHADLGEAMCGCREIILTISREEMQRLPMSALCPACRRLLVQGCVELENGPTYKKAFSAAAGH